MDRRDATLAQDDGAGLGLALHSRLVDEIEAHIVGDHRADCIEIPRVEMGNIGTKTFAISFGDRWVRQILSLGGKLAKLEASAMHRGLNLPAAVIPPLSAFPP